ncbi:MAG: hypothetical protein ACJ8AO_03045 [Gemmatimonadaceae bacterium]
MILFHRFLIGTAILFCAGFAAWSLNAARSSGSTGLLALGAAFGVAAVALVIYLWNLDRFLHGR